MIVLHRWMYGKSPCWHKIVCMVLENAQVSLKLGRTAENWQNSTMEDPVQTLLGSSIFHLGINQFYFNLLIQYDIICAVIDPEQQMASILYRLH